MVTDPVSLAFVSTRPLADLTGYARYSGDVVELLDSLGVDVRVVGSVRKARRHWIVLSHIDAVRFRDAWRWGRHGVIYLAHNEEVSARSSVARFDARARRPTQFARMLWLAARQSAIISQSEAVLSISEEDAGRFRARYGVDPIVVPPALMDAPPAAAESYPHVLIWGSYRWSVKRENARWALRDVLPRVSRPHAVTVAGLDANRLQPDAARLRNVVFSDSVRDPGTLFALRPLVLVAERQTGGVKLKTLDAAASGCPIVSTPSGIEGTGLSHGRGVLVGKNETELAMHVDELLADWSHALAMGEEARSIVDAHVRQWRHHASVRLEAVLSSASWASHE